MKSKKSKTKKINKKVILYSIVALGFIALTFLVDWIFLVGAIIMVYLNQKELMGNNKISNKAGHR